MRTGATLEKNHNLLMMLNVILSAGILKYAIDIEHRITKLETIAPVAFKMCKPSTAM